MIDLTRFQVENGKLGDIPTLQDLGFSPEECAKIKVPDGRSAFPFRGGETSGLRRIHEYFFESNAVAKYKETRNGLLGNNSFLS